MKTTPPAARTPRKLPMIVPLTMACACGVVLPWDIISALFGNQAFFLVLCLDACLIAFALRTGGLCTGWQVLFLSVLATIVIATRKQFGDRAPGDIVATHVVILAVVVVGCSLVGNILGGWLRGKVGNSLMSIVVNLFFLTCAGIVTVTPILSRCGILWWPSSHDELAGPPALSCNASDLRRTMVAPTLDVPLSPGTNVLWCATVQLAWNELMKQAGGSLMAANQSNICATLNRQDVQAADLDKDTYVVKAGRVKDTLSQIPSILSGKFNGQASPHLIPSEKQTQPEWFMAYSYLFVNLPVVWEFERKKCSFLFRGEPVQSFSIGDDPLGRRRSQVRVWDYINSFDFIIELKTRLSDQHLVLACIPPCSTLHTTISSVFARVGSRSAEHMNGHDTMSVPIVNFEIMREFNEFYGQTLVSDKGASLPIQEFLQQIRFRLDEKGAMLKSECILRLAGAFGPPDNRHFRFDRPFLIILRYKNASMPYFALWVDNAEVLVPWPNAEK